MNKSTFKYLDFDLTDIDLRITI